MTSIDLQTLLAQAPSGTQDAVAGVLTPQVQAALQQGATIAGDLAPTYDFIATVAGGGQPSPMQAVSAMAGIATLINPVAGAAIMAMGAIGSAVEQATIQVFDALGLHHDPPTAKGFAGGIAIGAQPVPYAPDAKGNYDPIWKKWDDLIAVAPSSGTTKVPVYIYPYFQYNVPTFDTASLYAMQRIMHSLAGKAHWYGYQTGNMAGGPVVDMSVPQNDFEKFFYPLLKKDMEYWWNGQSYLTPRDLLLKAIVAWNNVHQPAVPKTVKTLFGTTVTGDITYSPAEAASNSIPALLLSGVADATGGGTRGQSVTVNMGARMQPPPPGATVVHTPASNAGPAATYHMSATVVKTAKPASSGLTPWLLTAALGGGLYYMLRKK